MNEPPPDCQQPFLLVVNYTSGTEYARTQAVQEAAASISLLYTTLFHHRSGARNKADSSQSPYFGSTVITDHCLLTPFDAFNFHAGFTLCCDLQLFMNGTYSAQSVLSQQPKKPFGGGAVDDPDLVFGTVGSALLPWLSRVVDHLAPKFRDEYMFKLSSQLREAVSGASVNSRLLKTSLDQFCTWWEREHSDAPSFDLHAAKTFAFNLSAALVTSHFETVLFGAAGISSYTADQLKGKVKCQRCQTVFPLPFGFSLPLPDNIDEWLGALSSDTAVATALAKTLLDTQVIERCKLLQLKIPDDKSPSSVLLNNIEASEAIKDSEHPNLIHPFHWDLEHVSLVVRVFLHHHIKDIALRTAVSLYFDNYCNEESAPIKYGDRYDRLIVCYYHSDIKHHVVYDVRIRSKCVVIYDGSDNNLFPGVDPNDENYSFDSDRLARSQQVLTHLGFITKASEVVTSMGKFTNNVKSGKNANYAKPRSLEAKVNQKNAKWHSLSGFHVDPFVIYTQKDKYSCGPIAVLHALRLAIRDGSPVKQCLLLVKQANVALHIFQQLDFKSCLSKWREDGLHFVSGNKAGQKESSSQVVSEKKACPKQDCPQGSADPAGFPPFSSAGTSCPSQQQAKSPPSAPAPPSPPPSPACDL